VDKNGPCLGPSVNLTYHATDLLSVRPIVFQLGVHFPLPQLWVLNEFHVQIQVVALDRHQRIALGIPCLLRQWWGGTICKGCKMYRKSKLVVSFNYIIDYYITKSGGCCPVTILHMMMG
jgi:hypothetical protein